MENDYELYLQKWIHGIHSEIEYWDRYMATKGYGDTDGYNKYTAMERPFALEEHLRLPETSFIDVGSGPFSICGTKTDKTKLDFKAVDMMASVYQALKTRYGITTEVTPAFALMECLTEQFGTERFDIVHVSNALDHTFDPMYTILQLVAICRTGGQVILQHHQNEAEAAQYNGLHQWNCTLQNGKFEIWNMHRTIDVAEELGNIAEIYIERHAPLDKVLLTKKKAFALDPNPNRFLFESAIVQALQTGILKKHFTES